MLSQQYVNEYLRDNGYFVVFSGAVRDGIRDWLQVVAASPTIMAGAIPLERATFLNRRIIEHVCSDLGSDSNVVISKRYSVCITINNEITIRFKKLDWQFRPMSTKTWHVKRVWYNNAPLNNGDFENWINLSFGWKLNTAGAIIDLGLVNEYGDRVSWAIHLGNDGTGDQLVAQEPLFPSDDGTPSYTVKLRDTERARKLAEDENKGDSSSAS